MPTNSRF